LDEERKTYQESRRIYEAEADSLRAQIQEKLAML
jgi:hypothetical protein